eukprot:g5467.t1
MDIVADSKLLAAALLLLVVTGGSIPNAGSIPGADPSGRFDSSAALNTAVRSLCNATAAAAATAVGASAGAALTIMAPRDAVLDLAGGVYRMDAPLVIDSTVRCSGKLRVRGGTILAGDALGALGANHSFLVTVLEYWNGLGVSLEHIIFANNGTGGGLRVDAAHHVHVTDCQFVNFKSVGVWGSALLGMGHDLVVDRCRLTECTLPMAQCADIGKKTGTGIEIDFPDSHFRNTVITCSRAGVVNRAGSNAFHMLHIWTSCTGDAPFSANNTVAFADESGGGTRISDSYFDNAVVRISGYRGTTITNSLFNGGARLQLAPSLRPGTPDPAATDCQYWRGAVCGLIVRDNQFECGKMGCAGIDVGYAFPQAAHVYVESNAFENASLCTAGVHSCKGVKDCAQLLKPCGP